MKNKVLLSIIVFFFTLPSSMLPSLIEGTLVATPEGLKRVDELDVGDLVLAFDVKLMKCITTKVSKTTQKIEDTFWQVKANNELLCVTKDHLFFDLAQAQWIKAQDLTPQDSLTSCEFDGSEWQLSQINDVLTQQIYDTIIFYEIEFEALHSLCISESKIVTQNFTDNPSRLLGAARYVAIKTGKLMVGTLKHVGRELITSYVVDVSRSNISKLGKYVGLLT